MVAPHDALRQAARLAVKEPPPGLLPCAVPVYVAAKAAGFAATMQQFGEALDAAHGRALVAARRLAEANGLDRVKGDYQPGDVAIVRAGGQHCCALVTGAGSNPVCGVLAKEGVVTGRFRIVAAWRLAEAV
jgi:hypothetical protein